MFFTFHAVFSNSDRKKICCRRKVAVVKIEKLKVFIIKYYDIRKTYSVKFHVFCSVNLSYFYFFIHSFQSSILHKLKTTLNCQGLEFLSYEIELRNQVMQNDVTPLRFTNSMVKLLFFLFRVTNARLKNKKLHFELLTQWMEFYFLAFELRT